MASLHPHASQSRWSAHRAAGFSWSKRVQSGTAEDRAPHRGSDALGSAYRTISSTLASPISRQD